MIGLLEPDGKKSPKKEPNMDEVMPPQISLKQAQI